MEAPLRPHYKDRLEVVWPSAGLSKMWARNKQRSRSITARLSGQTLRSRFGPSASRCQTTCENSWSKMPVITEPASQCNHRPRSDEIGKGFCVYVNTYTRLFRSWLKRRLNFSISTES